MEDGLGSILPRKIFTRLPRLALPCCRRGYICTPLSIFSSHPLLYGARWNVDLEELFDLTRDFPRDEAVDIPASRASLICSSTQS